MIVRDISRDSFDLKPNYREKIPGTSLVDNGNDSVIIYLYVQFWLRMAALSERDKKVRTVASPAVRSVNKSRGTRNWAQNEPEYAICVLFITRLYYKALWIILCDLMW